MTLEWAPKRQYLSAAIASFGCVCAGTVLAWTSPALPQLTKKNSELTLTESEGGLVGSMVAIGAILSAIPAGFLAEKFGRKTLLQYLTLLFLAGWVAIGLSEDVGVVYFGRFVGGFASGAVCVCVPMYVSEIASVEIRGILGSFFQLGFCLGILAVNVLGALMDWRSLSYSGGILPAVYFLGLMFISESPRHNENEYKEIKVKEVPLMNQLKRRENWRALTVALGLVTFQQLSGVNAVIFYTSGIFTASGSSFSSEVSSIIVAAVQLLFSAISASIIEKFNRKLYLTISSTAMFFSLLLLGIYFHTKFLNIDISNSIPLISLITFIISFCFGFGPLPWLMMAELFSPEFKSVGCGVATMFNWSLVFLVTATFPFICNQLGEHYTFYIFAVFNLLATFFTINFVPETRGKTSEEIQMEFQ